MPKLDVTGSIDTKTYWHTLVAIDYYEQAAMLGDRQSSLIAASYMLATGHKGLLKSRFRVLVDVKRAAHIGEAIF
jgi:TPR repeat protein